MKNLMLVASMLLLLVGASMEVSAQTKAPLPDAELKIMTALPKIVGPAANQPVPLPEPFVVQAPNGNCYAFRCVEGQGCETCTLYWKDRNEDGLVNPKKELRCRCDGAPQAECTLEWQEVPCED